MEQLFAEMAKRMRRKKTEMSMRRKRMEQQFTPERKEMEEKLSKMSIMREMEEQFALERDKKVHELASITTMTQKGEKKKMVHDTLLLTRFMLIDEHYDVRVEGREIIYKLSKAAGLSVMVDALRRNVHSVDESDRIIDVQCFCVVASALGVAGLLPFLREVCDSAKSWQARHTGSMIVHQMTIFVGRAVVPHLRSLVETIGHGLNDDIKKVRTTTALALAVLAQVAAPNDINSFDSVLKPLWKGVRSHRGDDLATFLKAIGYIIPLMNAVDASYYTKEVMVVLIREFQSPDVDVKRVALKVLKQCMSTEGVEPDYIRQDILPEFFSNFSFRRRFLDHRNYKQLVETTVAMARKVGVADIVARIAQDLKDESDVLYKIMVIKTIEESPMK
ncbi:Splicing factor 3B subunit 1 [Capsicum baccatum]|uniref:Splicing factor 3B subunit 1 n=1 Tax=Capsicum baccatum TaxID=33114 RepID=A0A2G2VVM6_CAPBA|nr:Splicing factor 3B subunit 1 [Capsicum baccatum]